MERQGTRRSRLGGGDRPLSPHSPTRGLLVALLITIALSGCSQGNGASNPNRTAAPTGRILTLGDVDPDTPARRARRLQPLVDHLASQLAGFGIGVGRVVIARDIEEMSRLIRDGDVDLYLDSAFPSSLVSERSGSKILLRRWAQGAPSYWSVYITASDGNVRSLDELPGTLFAFQEEYSTSGFVLPAGHLLERGFRLEEVRGPSVDAAPGVIRYYFTRDEENTMLAVAGGKVAAGAISNQEYEMLPTNLRAQLRVIGRTCEMPRQLLSTRPDLETELVEGIVSVLLDLTGPDGSPVALDDSAGAWTWKFETITEETTASVARLAQLVQRVAAG